MKFAASTVLLSLGGVPMVGNTATGGIIGLTPEGARLCQDAARSGVGALTLVDHDEVGMTNLNRQLRLQRCVTCR